jgi:hypothetical protein
MAHEVTIGHKRRQAKDAGPHVPIGERIICVGAANKGTDSARLRCSKTIPIVPGSIPSGGANRMTTPRKVVIGSAILLRTEQRKTTHCAMQFDDAQAPLGSRIGHAKAHR